MCPIASNYCGNWVVFPAFGSFLVVFYKRQRNTIGYLKKKSHGLHRWNSGVISENVSTVPLPGSGRGAGGDSRKERDCTSLGRSWDLVWPEAQLLGEAAVPTHITFLPTVPGPPLFPKQVLAGGNGTLSTFQGKRLTASRSFLRRRGTWAGNGSSRTGCQ